MWWGPGFLPEASLSLTPGAVALCLFPADPSSPDTALGRGRGLVNTCRTDSSYSDSLGRQLLLSKGGISAYDLAQSPSWAAQLVRASFQSARGAGSIPGQSHMRINQYMHESMEQQISFSPPNQFLKKLKNKTGTEHVSRYVWNKWMGGCMDMWLAERMEGLGEWVGGWVDIWLSGWASGWVGGWVDGVAV